MEKQYLNGKFNESLNIDQNGWNKTNKVPDLI